MTDNCPHGKPFDPTRPYQPHWCRGCWRKAGGVDAAPPPVKPKPRLPLRGPCDSLGVRTEFRAGCGGNMCKHKCNAGEPVAVPGGVCQTCTKWVPEGGYTIRVGDRLDTPAATSDRVVCTAAVGDVGAAMLAATGPLMREYARRIGADFFSVTGPPLNAHYPVGDKFRLSLLSGWERACFIDVDALVHPDAPDIFASVPVGHVGFRDDAQESGDMRPYIEATCRSQGVTPHPRYAVLNSGVLVWDAGSPLWTPPAHPLPPNCHVAEQCWVQHNVLGRGLPVAYLSRRWNHQWWSDRTLKGALADPPYILHLAGLSQMDAVPGWGMTPAQVRSAMLAAAAWAARRIA